MNYLSMEIKQKEPGRVRNLYVVLAACSLPATYAAWHESGSRAGQAGRRQEQDYSIQSFQILNKTSEVRRR